MSAKHDAIDVKVAFEGKLKTINELDAEKDKLDSSNLSAFLENFDDTFREN